MANKNTRATLQQVEAVLMDANSTQVKLNELSAYHDQPAKEASAQSVNALRAASLVRRRFANASGSYSLPGSSYGSFLPNTTGGTVLVKNPSVGGLTPIPTTSSNTGVISAQDIIKGVSAQFSGSGGSSSQVSLGSEYTPSAPTYEERKISPAAPIVTGTGGVTPATVFANIPPVEAKAEPETGMDVKFFKGLLILLVIAALCYVLFKK